MSIRNNFYLEQMPGRKRGARNRRKTECTLRTSQFYCPYYEKTLQEITKWAREMAQCACVHAFTHSKRGREEGKGGWKDRPTDRERRKDGWKDRRTKETPESVSGPRSASIGWVLEPAEYSPKRCLSHALYYWLARVLLRHGGKSNAH